jgi:SAM-dependent methyltransferase
MTVDEGDGLPAEPASQVVASFYNRHPYPPPVAELDSYRRWWNDHRRLADANLFWPAQPYRGDRSILVAGCGTSQAARYALRWPNAQITGIDFSPSSIEETAKLQRKHGIGNLELRQLPIEQAAELGKRFNYIVCTGVLHHLPDPEAGLRTLGDLLEPDGAMHLMVYAPYGRTGIYLLQDYCRRLGIGTSSAEIRDLGTSLRLLSAEHPIAHLLRAARDFASEAGVADALLNPQDRAYSVPQLFELLAAAGLSFGRWTRQAHYLPHCGALTQSPHQSRLKALAPAEQYAAIELFRGCMVEHSLVVYRDAGSNAHRVTFDGEDWLDYIPIRLPDTIIAMERLPPGAAAVLINPHHNFTDIYLPIDATQKALFDLIDARRSIGEIAPGEGDRQVARILFERLWQYDQILLDLVRAQK